MLTTVMFGRSNFGEQAATHSSSASNTDFEVNILGSTWQHKRMIPVIFFYRRPGPRGLAVALLPLLMSMGVAFGKPAHAAEPGEAPAPSGPAVAAGAPAATATAACLPSGDGYFRAHVAGAIDAIIDWPNSGTRCEGETKSSPPGVRLSFQRAAGAAQDLLFVFGLTGVSEGKPGRAIGANLTIIVQGSDRIFGTLGDKRCTVDSLTQRPLPIAGTYRLEARGFCTQPAHAVRGTGDVLVSTFEFAGSVNYGPSGADPGASSAHASVGVGSRAGAGAAAASL